MSTPGERLLHFRKQMKLTQAEFAKALGVSRSYVLNIETGRNEPSREFLRKLHDAFGVSADWVLTGRGESIPTSEASLPRDGEEQTFSPGTLSDRVKLLSGRIAAGVPIEAEENILDWLYLGPAFRGCIALQVRGDSMIGVGIGDGDYVLVRPMPEIRSGEVAAIILDGDAAVKRIIDEGDFWCLQSENPNMKPIRIPKEEWWRLRVAGKVVGVIKKFPE